MKQEVAGHFKQILLEKKLQISYDPELINQLNVETFELTKEGRVKLSHREMMHEDHFWAVALACRATKEGTPTLGIVEIPRS